MVIYKTGVKSVLFEQREALHSCQRNLRSDTRENNRVRLSRQTHRSRHPEVSSHCHSIALKHNCTTDIRNIIQRKECRMVEKVKNGALYNEALNIMGPPKSEELSRRSLLAESAT
jgi:hypothetical protein